MSWNDRARGRWVAGGPAFTLPRHPLYATAREENAMEQKDYWTDTLRRKEKADEDRYFAEQDRQLIEKLHQ